MFLLEAHEEYRLIQRYVKQFNKKKYISAAALQHIIWTQMTNKGYLIIIKIMKPDDSD